MLYQEIIQLHRNKHDNNTKYMKGLRDGLSTATANKKQKSSANFSVSSLSSRSSAASSGLPSNEESSQEEPLIDSDSGISIANNTSAANENSINNRSSGLALLCGSQSTKQSKFFIF